MVFIDTETYSPIPLKHGLDNYSRAAEIMLVAWAIDNGPVQLWDLTRGEPIPAELAAASTTDTLVAHNVQFDRTLLSRTGILETRLEDWHCTMIQAYAHGLPGALGLLCQIFGIAAQDAKIADGRQYLHLFCKPDKEGNRATEQTHPVQWQRFRQYARQDVSAARALYHMLPRWNYPDGKDYGYWLIDQAMNERGFKVDLDLAEAALDLATREKKNLNRRTQAATGNQVDAATQRDKLLAHVLEEWGIVLPNMQAATLERRIADPSIPEPVKELLRLRLMSSRNTAAKYRTLLRAAGPDHRLRYSVQFCGAATTGRDSGRLFQPQNLMRPTLPQAEIDTAVEAVLHGAAEFLYDDITEITGNCVRSAIIAEKGSRLVVSDLSSVEGRMLAWLANDQPILDFYRRVDAGEADYDSYMLAYSLVFGGDPSQVTKAERTIGKPIELSSGYGGAAASFKAFAMVYKLNLEELAEKIWTTGDPNQLAICLDGYEFAREKRFHGGLPPRQYAAFRYVIERWRANRQPTVRFWSDLQDAYRAAVLNPGKVFAAGRHIRFRYSGQWLRMRLPSGRFLCFTQPRAGQELTYMGLDHYTHKWTRLKVYGGKLAGLATQASAADLLRESKARVEAHPEFNLLLPVHDELVTESRFAPAAWLSELLAQTPEWAPDLPLAAEGYVAQRYRK